MKQESPHLCFVGNMLGQNAGYITTQGEIVADLFRRKNFQVTCVSSKINKSARLSEIIQTLIKGRKKIDVVLLDVYSGLYFTIAETVSRLCDMFRIPLIMVLHGGELPRHILKYPRWSNSVFSRAAILVAPSLFIAEKMNKAGFDVKVIPNVIELDDYDFRERSAIKPNLIWMRSFHSTYNPEMAVKVLSELKKYAPQAVLTMAGKDKGLENSVKNLVKELNLSDSVRFTGFLDPEKKAEELNKADIFLNTNRIDNMPVSVLEARACGLPVIATNVGGIPCLIDSGENGLLVENEDVDAMVSAVITLLEQPETTRKISRGGRLIAELSGWEKVYKDWNFVIGEALNKSSRAVGAGLYAKR